MIEEKQTQEYSPIFSIDEELAIYSVARQAAKDSLYGKAEKLIAVFAGLFLLMLIVHLYLSLRNAE